jgi:squalene-hopene/tetraprenyl-beta-curcumene cyclase
MLNLFHPSQLELFMLSRRTVLAASLAAASAYPFAGFALAAEADYDKMVAKAIDYLKTKGRAEDGSYSKNVGIGVTALVTTALLRHGRSPDDPLVAESLKFLEKSVQADGGIYTSNSRVPNYEACVALMCFTEANKDGRYKKLIAGADKYLRGLQATNVEKSDLSFGGGGYDGKRRPDLSNTAYLVDALKSAGAGADDQALQNALIFVSRCQNLESEHNTSPQAAKVNDGGFYYTVAGGGQGPATDSQGLASTGTMSYAGLKSMIYAGVSKDDKRVKAAVKWIEKNYNLKQNPGQGDAGLFYYYNTFAKSLDALGTKEITDADGKKHDWRKELVEALAEQQKEDGSWINKNRQFLENDPNLVTAYALLALSYCKPSSK